MGITHSEWLQEVERCYLEVKADHFYHIFDLDRSLMSDRRTTSKLRPTRKIWMVNFPVL